MAVLVLLAGCGPDDADLRRSVLDEAAAAATEGTLAFNLTIDAQEGALAGFGEAAGPLAAVLAGSSAAGVIEEDRVAVGLAVAGADLAQVRITGPGEQYVRFDLGALTELATGSPGGVGGELEEALADAGLEVAARDAVLAAARGQWVRLASAGSGEEELTATPGERSTATSVREALAALLASAEPVAHTGDLQATPFDGRLEVTVDVERALALAGRALAGIAPSAVPTATSDEQDVVSARVHVRDGVVRAVVVDLGPLAAADDETATTGTTGDGDGRVQLELDLRLLDVEEALVTAPEVAATVTLEQLGRAAAVLEQLPAAGGP